jgi:hypothetical protein
MNPSNKDSILGRSGHSAIVTSDKRMIIFGGNAFIVTHIYPYKETIVLEMCQILLRSMSLPSTFLLLLRPLLQSLDPRQL